MSQGPCLRICKSFSWKWSSRNSRWLTDWYVQRCSRQIWCFQLCLRAEASSGNLTERTAAGSEYSLNVCFFSVVDNIIKVRVMRVSFLNIAMGQSWPRHSPGGGLRWAGPGTRGGTQPRRRTGSAICRGQIMVTMSFISPFCFWPSVLLPDGDPELAGAAASEVPEELGGGQDVALLARHPPFRPAQPSA